MRLCACRLCGGSSSVHTLMARMAAAAAALQQAGGSLC